ncbi:MAG: RNA polymerase sigma factor [Spirochaetota bacterium]
MKIYSNDPEAFQAVYDKTFNAIVRVAYHITLDADVAEDICQEAFIRFYHRTIPFPSEDQARYWLIRVAKNLSFNYYKRKKRERSVLERYSFEPKPHERNGEELLMRSETEKLVHRAVERLPESLRSVIVLKEYGNLSYYEIGKVLHITENNVKVRVHRARNMLGTLLKEEEAHVL